MMLPTFISVLFLLTNRSAFAENLTSGSDLLALYSLRSSLGLRARDWPRKTDPCSLWTGVGCRSGRVVSLNLSGLRRTRLGRLDPKFAVDGIQNLTKLESFNSTGFPLPGPIPDWFGRLPNLSALVLRGASVSGEIPDSLGNADNITVLTLASNSITGNIPPTLSQLGNLTALDLSGNSISGSIPGSLASLVKLVVLDLSSNFVSGEIPESVGILRSLKALNLSNNSITGPVPAGVGNLTALSSLDLSINLLFGTLPDSFGNLSRLQMVRLNRNNFSGRLPDSLWSWENLQVIDLSSNNFTGEFPSTVVTNAGANGSVFNLSNNFYYGKIPSGFARSISARFSVADLSKNYFDGDVPIDSGMENVALGSNCFRNELQQRRSTECQQFYAARGLTYEGPLSPAPAPSPSTSSHKKSMWKWILIGVIGGVVVLVLAVVAIVLCIAKHRGGSRDVEQSGASVSTAPTGTVAQSPGYGVSALPSGVALNLSSVGEAFTFELLVRATADFSDTNLIRHGHSGDLYHGVFDGGTRVVVKQMNIETVKKAGYVVELEFFGKASHARIVPFLGHCLDNEEEKFLVYKYMPHGDLSNALYVKSGQDNEGLQSLDWITRLKIAIGVSEALCYLHHECTPPLVHRTSEQSAAGLPSATCAYDVYCLGKVLLELVTGKLGISGSNDASTTEWLGKTLQYINVYEKELITKIVDPSLLVDEDLQEEVWAMAIVAKSCLNPKPSKRPPVKYILKALENPLKVVREDNTGSARLKAGSSRGSWNAAVFAVGGTARRT